MAKWRKLNNESIPDDTRFYEGLDTGTLYYKNHANFFVVLIGRGTLEGHTGLMHTIEFVRQGRGIRMITAGTRLEITL